MERSTQLVLSSTILILLLASIVAIIPSVTAKPLRVTYFRESEVICAPSDGIGVEVCTVMAECNPGDLVTGGGFREHSDQSFGLIWDHFETRPEIDQKGINGWFVEGMNPTTNEFVLTAFAVCMESR